jgi:light-regulated signal transduction histidine kinase (bacteriophytochrome)
MKNNSELLRANKELIFQNEEKEKRAAELVIANIELAFQNEEKEKRAAELILANKELAFQNEEKEKRAAELVLANKRLVFHNEEKEKRAAELAIANVELAFQNQEKENRAAELIAINNKLGFQKIQLQDFCNIISHNLRAPLVNISMLVEFIAETDDEEEQKVFREKLTIASHNLNEVFNELVESLQVKQDTEIESEELNLQEVLKKVCDGLQGHITKAGAIIETDFEEVKSIFFPAKYLTSILHNLVSNSLKYKCCDRHPIIKIAAKKINGDIVLSVADNGLGINLVKHQDNLFKIRKVFHSHPEAKGFGLFITKSQVEAMGGMIWAESVEGKGATFYVNFINQNA